MTLKNAALLALVATLFLSCLLALDFINTLVGILHDVIPVVALLRSLIYLLASLSLTLFFYVFHKAQPQR